MTVTAQDAFDNTLIGYTGTLQFASSDGQAVLPSDYAFTSGDAGIHTFANGGTLKTAGNQTIDVNDSVETSATGSATVSVIRARSTTSTSPTRERRPPGLRSTSPLPPRTRTATLSLATPARVRRLHRPELVARSEQHGAVVSRLGHLRRRRRYGLDHALQGGVDDAHRHPGPDLRVSGNFTVDPGSANNFLVPTPGTQTAGVAFNETLTARDQWSNVATSYTGSNVVAFTGPSSSPAPSSTAPSYPGSVTFAAGVGTASITLFKAESTTLTATQGPISGVSGNFTVDPGSANNFLVPTPGTQTAGVAFNETLTARDQWSNVATSYTGSNVVAFTGPGLSGSEQHGAVVSGLGHLRRRRRYGLDHALQGGVDDAHRHPGPDLRCLGQLHGRPGLREQLPRPDAGNADGGVAFNETLTARDQWSNVATGYAGSKVVAFSGPAYAPTEPQPSYPGNGDLCRRRGHRRDHALPRGVDGAERDPGPDFGISGNFTVIRPQHQSWSSRRSQARRPQALRSASSRS